MRVQRRSNRLLLLLLCLYASMVYMFNGQEFNIRYVHYSYFALVGYLFITAIRCGIRITKPNKYMIAYVVFGAISILWSPIADLSFTRTTAVALLLLLSILCCSYYDKRQISTYILVSIIIGGLSETIYCIQYYGIDGIKLLIASATRMNDFAINNVNALANTLVIAVVATISVILFFRKYYCIILLLPELFLLMAFESRTSFIALMISCLIMIKMYINYNRSEHVPEYPIVIAILVITLIAVLIRLLTGDSGIASRLGGLSSFVITGSEGGKASSLMTRSSYVSLGFEEFLAYPLGGRGIGCAGYILLETYGYMTYLHNNYIEILASGGIIGFLLYYGCYLYLLKKHIRKMKWSSSVLLRISFLTMICELITHIGIVTYYSKVNWLAMTLWFIVAEMEEDYEEESIISSL